VPSGATLSTLQNILKDLYLPPVVEQLNNEVLLMQRLRKSSRDIIPPGNVAVIPLHVGRSGGIGSRGEAEALPAAGAQTYAKATYDVKAHYGRLKVTGLSMVKTRSDAQSFLRALASEVDFLKNDLIREEARQAYMDGTGKIAACAANSNTTTLTLASSAKEPISKGWLYVGMLVDIGSASNAQSVATGREILAINPNTPSITISGSNVTTAATDFVYRSGNVSGSSTTGSREALGLDCFVGTSAPAIHPGGINEATDSFWAPVRVNAGGALSNSLLVQTFNQVRLAGGKPTLMIGSFGMQRALFLLLQGLVRYVNDPTNLKGGFTAIEYQGLPFVADRDAFWGRVYVLDESHFRVITTGDWNFLDEDGKALKWVPGFDMWEAVLAKYYNYATDRRNVQAVLYGLTDDPSGV
jgi:hypothetical protein